MVVKLVINYLFGNYAIPIVHVSYFSESRLIPVLCLVLSVLVSVILGLNFL